MKILVLIFTLFISLHAQKEEYFPFVQEQFQVLEQLNENNISEEQLEDIIQKQSTSYQLLIETILSNKQSYSQAFSHFNQKIFRLQKHIKINTYRGNKYAVIRDETQIMSYKVLLANKDMILSIIQSLDTSDFVEFSKIMNDAFARNQEKISDLSILKYDKYLKIQGDTSTLNQVKEKVRELHLINDINSDFIKYLSIYSPHIFSLGKYSRLGLVNLTLYFKYNPLTQKINDTLNFVNLSIMKLLIMLSLFILLYILRYLTLRLLDLLLSKFIHKEQFVDDIIKETQSILGILVITIFVQLNLFIYNDFYLPLGLSVFFKIAYTILVTYFVYSTLNAIVLIKLTKLSSSTSIKNEVLNLSIKILNFIIWTIGFLFVLSFAGADLTAILSGLGIGGFAVAFAAKETLSNFIGTIAILFSDIFSQGDWIEVDGKEGVIVEIGLRVTTLRTFDNSLISIPNAIIASSDVRNWSRRKLGRRIKMSLGLRYDSKSEDIQKALLEIKTMLAEHKGIATEKTEFSHSFYNHLKLVSKDDEQGVKKLLMVYLDEFSDSSINVLVYCFTKTVDWSEWLGVKEDVMFKIIKIFEENNLAFAFPSLSLYQED
ncbi:mechanosensitive ion channel family protein [Sulfurimonas sp. MAG313]|nr:mechanosensitive ion channel family protein [Sulfurimonas sp. MAG313]MDF1881692.1 mechanosensitive ion channel family protein [Sulfurimonas sp. MAG313]